MLERVEFLCTADSNVSQNIIHLVKSPLNLLSESVGSLTLVECAGGSPANGSSSGDMVTLECVGEVAHE